VNVRTTLLINTIPVSQTSLMPMPNFLPPCCRYGGSGRVVCVVGLRPIACWECGFESNWGHGGTSVVSVVYSQV
jgi:hypothetical protein